MDRITPEWLNAQMIKRGDKARIARAAGLSPDQMSKVLSGVRQLTVDEHNRLLEYFGLARGFSDAAAQPYQPPDMSTAALALMNARQTLGHAALFRMTGDAPEHALLAGDVLIADLKTLGGDGALVLATEARATGEARTLVARHRPPLLIVSLQADLILDERRNDPSVAVVGSVRGVLRGIAAKE